MANLSTPGVYIREVEIAQPERLRMDIAGFVGQAERGPLNQPQPLANWGQFTDIYGNFVGFSYLSYSVYGFFLNGGQKCHAVRVAHETAKSAYISLPDKKDTPIISVKAINQGKWGNTITVAPNSQSTDSIVLAELKQDFIKGRTTAAFSSVAGLCGADTGCGIEGDLVTLVHIHNPFIREQVQIREINFKNSELTFTKEVSNHFPAGSQLIGKGFKLTFRFEQDGQVIREEIFDNLSMDKNNDHYFARVINGDLYEKDYIKRDAQGNSILVHVEDLCQSSQTQCYRLKSDPKTLTSGSDGSYNLGVHYYTGYKDGAYFRLPEPDGSVSQKNKEKLFGLTAFESITEAGIIAIPDLIIPDLYAAIPEFHIPEEGIIFAEVPASMPELENLKQGQRDIIAHCEKMGERFAILDSPRGSESGKGSNRIDEWPNNFNLLSNAKYAALYYPWIKEKEADFEGRDLFIPSSGHIAGVYARTEQERGIGKAPANEILQGVVELEFAIDDEEQALLNPRGINCLRCFPGRGLMVWGARTLSREPLWRYVNVRRVSLAIVKHIMRNLLWTVFEPNDTKLWNKIVATLKLFFTDLFQSGALAGDTPEQAFFVKCDEETNPPDVVDKGQVITHIGFAPARPAEFVIVTIKRTTESISVVEQ